MRSTCTVCDESIVSNVTGEVWYHQPPGDALKAASGKPHPHVAQPGEIEHNCTRPNRFCPLCTDDAREWLAKRLAVLGDSQLPTPGLPA